MRSVLAVPAVTFGPLPMYMDDSGLGDSIHFFGGHKVTRAAALIEMPVDWSDHYRQMAIYLRLNGLLPPTAKRKEHE